MPIQWSDIDKQPYDSLQQCHMLWPTLVAFLFGSVMLHALYHARH